MTLGGFIKSISFIIGIIASFYLIGGLFFDLRGIDKMNINVETDVVEEIIVTPTIANIFVKTSNGVIKRGIMGNYHIDCYTGAFSLKIHGGSDFNYLQLLDKGFYKEVVKKYTIKEACLVGEQL